MPPELVEDWVEKKNCLTDPFNSGKMKPKISVRRGMKQVKTTTLTIIVVKLSV